MLLRNAFAWLCLCASAISKKPVSLCDKYSAKIFGNTTSDAEYLLMILLVNTAEIGNYTTPNVGVAVNGVLNPGTYHGRAVNLLKYFDGSLIDSNVGPSAPVAMNWLDDGGAAPLRLNKSSNTVQSNQASLVTHLYQFFGAILGCSAQFFPAYAGHTSMFNVHQYMSLDTNQVSYHNEQFRLSALSLGFSPGDADVFFSSLQYIFNARCAPPTTIVAANGPLPHSVCAHKTCPLEIGSNCTSYANEGVFPAPAPAQSSSAPHHLSNDRK